MADDCEREARALIGSLIPMAEGRFPGESRAPSRVIGDSDRWSAVASDLQAEGHRTTAALLKEAEPSEAGRTPSGVLLIKLGFKYDVLLNKWNQGDHRRWLEESLRKIFAEAIVPFAVLAERLPAAAPVGLPKPLLTQSSRKRSVRQEPPTARQPRPDEGEMRLQAAWLSARLASEAAACLLGGSPSSEMKAAADLYEMSVETELLAFRVMVRGRQLLQRIAAAQGERDPRRSFTADEKRLLHQAAAGLCESCGIPLCESWHADHRYPHSRGGPTSLPNGAALCADCNLRKGAKALTVEG